MLPLVGGVYPFKANSTQQKIPATGLVDQKLGWQLRSLIFLTLFKSKALSWLRSQPPDMCRLVRSEPSKFLGYHSKHSCNLARSSWLSCRNRHFPRHRASGQQCKRTNQTWSHCFGQKALDFNSCHSMLQVRQPMPHSTGTQSFQVSKS